MGGTHTSGKQSLTRLSVRLPALPCERVCPAAAIRFHAAAATSDAATSTGSSADSVGGVIADRCYGCGRCIPVCPFGIISAEEHQRTHEDTLTLLGGGLVDAIEIHTLPGHVEAFNALWASIGEAAGSLKLVAVSLPDLGGAMHHAMHAMYRTMHPHLSAANLWQLDGRPMSGDIGAGATRATIRLAARVAAFEDRPPGYLQIAGEPTVTLSPRYKIMECCLLLLLVSSAPHSAAVLPVLLSPLLILHCSQHGLTLFSSIGAIPACSCVTTHAPHASHSADDVLSCTYLSPFMLSQH
ncbi:hypothetical protein CLOP_g21582 [Closterium sp. NIES-67]|nr:hypothetical protein CLOP_g21582 [Closterium sp. NIES-67]